MQRDSETVDEQPCMCGAGNTFAECCGYYITQNKKAPTTEKLMRSRYSAYVLGIEEHLLKTWHASTRPAQLNLNADEGLSWLGLRILACEKGGGNDVDGSVEFVAEYQTNGAYQKLHEKSRFVKENGQWYYLDGDITGVENNSSNKSKPGRNAPCPCGSDKKFKRCCGQAKK